jgi:hypothetical protein
VGVPETTTAVSMGTGGAARLAVSGPGWLDSSDDRLDGAQAPVRPSRRKPIAVAPGRFMTTRLEG